MSPMTSFDELPVEIIGIILEKAIDAESLERQDLCPSKSLQVLLASIHTSSRLRAVAWAYRPLWRAVAGAIPSSLLNQVAFPKILDFCSQRTGSTLEEVSFASCGAWRNNSGLSQELLKAIEIISALASSMRAMRLPTVSCDSSATKPAFKKLMTVTPVLETIRAHLDDVVEV